MRASRCSHFAILQSHCFPLTRVCNTELDEFGVLRALIRRVVAAAADLLHVTVAIRVVVAALAAHTQSDPTAGRGGRELKRAQGSNKEENEI